MLFIKFVFFTFYKNFNQIIMANKFFFIFLFLVNGSVFSQVEFNKFDDNGKKNGLWKGVYEDTKNSKYEGVFEHGIEVGTFTFFDNTKTKTVIAIRDFNPIDKSVYTIFYDQKKNKVSEGKVINRLYEGQWKYYHKTSVIIMTLENYKIGKLEGLRSVFYPSGKIAEEINYKNGLKDGFYKRYTESGIIIEESNYKNNEYEGLAFFNDPDDGKNISKGKFIKGKKAGLWQFFNKGKFVKEINMSELKNASNSY
jgi:antitoxin component YwqK of YwqJK toxin-antitoxin module